MKIAYVLGINEVLTGQGNGIKSQALTWANSLKELNQEVIFINPWDNYRWSDFDVIHLFGSSNTWFLSFADKLRKINPHIVWSPICDDITKAKIQQLKTHMGCNKLHLFSLPFIRRQAYPLFQKIFVRSNYEKEYLIKAYNANKNNIIKIPLSISYDINYEYFPKENFCLHISSIYQPRKNVLRLIQAANKYGFKLILAGNTGSEKEFYPLKKEIGNNLNIQVKGFISEKEKIDLYKRAKVFALPSIMEGVGIVAVDAAIYGCEIVITNIGGPKEYYDNMAYTVNPYNIDDIGKTIMKAMNSKNSHQPYLSKHVLEKYNKKHIAQSLLQEYQNLQ